MTPANRSKGPRPRARSTAERQGAIWFEILRRTEFTAPEIADATGSPLSTVQQYLVALARGGFVRQTEPPIATQAGNNPAIWKRTARHKLAPLVTHETRTARPQADK